MQEKEGNLLKMKILFPIRHLFAPFAPPFVPFAVKFLPRSLPRKTGIAKFYREDR